MKKGFKGFTPLHPENRGLKSADEHRQIRFRSIGWGVTGFTLIELIAVVVIIGILAAIAYPQYQKTKETALGREAVANLKLIFAAQKVFHMTHGTYYPDPVAYIDDINTINSGLKLSISDLNWSYVVRNEAFAVYPFMITASRNGGGGYLDCSYSVYWNNASSRFELAPAVSCAYQPGIVNLGQ